MNTYKSNLISFPCIVQPKLNGVYAELCDGVLTSKTGRFYPALTNAQWPMTGGMRFLGELWHRDWSLQRILGAVNRDTPNRDSHYIEFWIHDLMEFLPTYKRLERIEKFAPQHPRVKRVWFEKIYSTQEGDDFYIRQTAMDLEGIVYKDYNCYPKDARGILKRKPMHDSEFICVRVIEGRGKRKGHVGAFICRTYEGAEFKVGGGQVDYPTLAKLLTSPPIGKMLTCRYQHTSDGGIPLCAQFISVRDYE